MDREVLTGRVVDFLIPRDLAYDGSITSSDVKFARPSSL